MSIEIALEVARNNPIKKLPQMGAVIVDKKGKLLSYGINSKKSNPFAAKYGRHPDAIYPHAEISAIKSAIKKGGIEQLEGGTIFVARVKKNGTPALAKPCSGCARAIYEFGIHNIIWTE